MRRLLNAVLADITNYWCDKCRESSYDRYNKQKSTIPWLAQDRSWFKQNVLQIDTHNSLGINDNYFSFKSVFCI